MNVQLKRFRKITKKETFHEQCMSKIFLLILWANILLTLLKELEECSARLLVFRVLEGSSKETGPLALVQFFTASVKSQMTTNMLDISGLDKTRSPAAVRHLSSKHKCLEDCGPVWTILFFPFSLSLYHLFSCSLNFQKEFEPYSIVI